MTVVQRTSSNLCLNPHLHVVFLDRSYQGGTTSEDEIVWREHGQRPSIAGEGPNFTSVGVNSGSGWGTSLPTTSIRGRPP